MRILPVFQPSRAGCRPFLAVASNRLHRATLNSLRGLNSAARSEPAVRQELAALVLSILLAPLAAPNVPWAVAMIGVVLFILIIELLNTAIEKFADHVTPERNAAIGTIKDIGSAAVLCALVLGGLIWIAALTVRLGFL
jgi:diacylglycerol kinase (ATP)